MFIVITSFKVIPEFEPIFLSSWNELSTHYMNSNMLENADIIHSIHQYVAICCWKASCEWRLSNGIQEQNQQIKQLVNNINKSCYEIIIEHYGDVIKK